MNLSEPLIAPSNEEVSQPTAASKRTSEVLEPIEDDDLIVLPPPPKKIFQLIDLSSDEEDEETPGISNYFSIFYMKFRINQCTFLFYNFSDSVETQIPQHLQEVNAN